MSLIAKLFRRSPSAPATDVSDARGGDFESRVYRIGSAFLNEARTHTSGLLSRRFWNDKLMDWSMKDDAFKVQLFRFVDAYPSFKTPQAMYEHLVDFMGQPGVKPPPGMNLGLKAGGAMKGTIAKTMTGQITGMAEKFIAGTDARSAVDKLHHLWNDGTAFSVDLLGEACISNVEADAYQRKYLDLIENLPHWVEDWPANERLEHDHLGRIPRTNVSVKISSLAARTDPIAFEHSIADCMDRLMPILRAATANRVFINFDMETFHTKDLTIELFKRCCRAVDFEGGLALQAYLRSGDDDARDVIDWAKREGRVVTVRLVKGAYWDYETIHAELMGWPAPVWSTKSRTDACFERMSKAFIDATPKRDGEAGVKLALGSHNVRSIAVALAELERVGLPRSALELQMLYGMADPLKAAAVERGLRLREYVPVGEMVPGMAYLVRRLLENTSNESWLRAGFFDDAAPEELLADPARMNPTSRDREGAEERTEDRDVPAMTKPMGRREVPPLPHGRGSWHHQLSASVPGLADGKPFANEPLRNFADATQREAFADAVASAHVPDVANDGTIEDADRKVASAVDAFPGWRDTDVLHRARCLTRAADLMRQRRDELAALVLKENGKDWRNADADVCEAIDFCEFYARQAVGLFRRQRLGRFVGELDEQWHEPRGVCAVVSPWNFPLAIAGGMTTAALVAGNAVILKPAEQTPACATALCEILWEAGVPREILHCLTGVGETVGAHLVRHERVDMVAFTGSAAVGRDILQAAVTQPPRGQLARHVVCETGGKNAIIVDASADLDEAVVGVRDSAFRFAGQKCSACSRAIVVADIYDAFLDRLVESTRSLIVGDPANPATDVGPVIDREAADNIRRYIEIGKQEGTLVHPTDGDSIDANVGGKPLIRPHIFRDVRPDHRLAQEEVFGPVLAVMKATNFDDALAIANAVDFRLTGAVYTRKPSHLEQTRERFRVGNLYLNRGCTGALVGRQPFGGFGRSGLGTKAGGHDYLKQFTVPRSVTENTLRRGFAPDVEAST